MTSKELLGKSHTELNALAFELTARGNLFAACFVSRFSDYYDHIVKVVKGRKVPHGITGKVGWMGVKYFDPQFPTTSIRIDCDNGNTYFTNINNVELV